MGAILTLDTGLDVRIALAVRRRGGGGSVVDLLELDELAQPAVRLQPPEFDTPLNIHLADGAQSIVIHQPGIDAAEVELVVAGEVADLAAGLKVVKADRTGAVLVLANILLDDLPGRNGNDDLVRDGLGPPALGAPALPVDLDYEEDHDEERGDEDGEDADKDDDGPAAVRITPPVTKVGSDHDGDTRRGPLAGDELGELCPGLLRDEDRGDCDGRPAVGTWAHGDKGVPKGGHIVVDDDGYGTGGLGKQDLVLKGANPPRNQGNPHHGLRRSRRGIGRGIGQRGWGGGRGRGGRENGIGGRGKRSTAVRIGGHKEEAEDLRGEEREEMLVSYM